MGYDIKGCTPLLDLESSIDDYLLDMAYTKPLYSPSQVNEAGDVLINPSASPSKHDRAIEIIDNWRSSHNFPLNTFQMWLRRNAKDVDNDCIVAQRIKRLSSIQFKLENFKKKGSTLKLSEMQDMGGCRAILKDVNCVKDLVRLYRESSIRHTLDYENDYINSPKIRTGYRSFHLIYKYVSDENATYNGHRIEIQLRTSLQHAWATAVETVGTFKGQVLKSNEGEPSLLRFFKLMSAIIADSEGAPLVYGLPQTKTELIDELRKHQREIDMIKHVKDYGGVMKEIREKSPDEEIQGTHYFLLKLNTVAKEVTVKRFRAQDIKLAEKERSDIEHEKNSDIDVVLVSAESEGLLRRAYPNYFLNMEKFVEVLNKTLES